MLPNDATNTHSQRWRLYRESTSRLAHCVIRPLPSLGLGLAALLASFALHCTFSGETSALAAGGAEATRIDLEIDWRTSPLDLDLRGMNGERYTFQCPPGKPEPAQLFGSGIYTDASSICTAAVHAGAIHAKTGGIVTIEIRPGQNGGYIGSEQNSLASHDYERAWSGSFVVVAQQTKGVPENPVQRNPPHH